MNSVSVVPQHCNKQPVPGGCEGKQCGPQARCDLDAEGKPQCICPECTEEVSGIGLPEIFIPGTPVHLCNAFVITATTERGGLWHGRKYLRKPVRFADPIVPSKPKCIRRLRGRMW